MSATRFLPVVLALLTAAAPSVRAEGEWEITPESEQALSPERPLRFWRLLPAKNV